METQQGGVQQQVSDCADLVAVVRIDLYGLVRKRPVTNNGVKKMKLSIIVPAYNEKDTLLKIFGRLKQVEFPVETELILVDDGSTDGTREMLIKMVLDHNIIAVFNDNNRGKGARLRQGFDRATGDIIITQDADLEYDPEEIPRIIGPILKREAEVVYGTRFAGTYEHKKTVNYYGNRFITWFTNFLYGSDLTDMETGYKAFRAELLTKFELKEDGFGIEPEITAKFLKMGTNIRELPISYNPRTYDEGKKINWRDGLHAIWVLIRERFRNG